MSKRSYDQFCLVACALDVIGERWTLLLVRELLYGPRRYTDLQRALPGIGTNLLARRLKDLEAAELIQKRTLPPPAASTVYELAPAAEPLLPVINSLAAFGSQHIPIPPPEHYTMSSATLMSGMRFAFDAAAADGVTLGCEFRVGEDVFFADVVEGELKVGFGRSRLDDLVVSAEPKAFFVLLTQKGELENYLADGRVTLLEGEGSELEKFIKLFFNSS